MITIYHNPRCGKSRECLAFLESSDQKIEIIRYLENPLSFEELTEIIKKLQCTPIELIRTKEPIWVTLYKNKPLSDSDLIQAIVDHPILMERPIAVYKNKAVIARPLDKIHAIL